MYQHFQEWTEKECPIKYADREIFTTHDFGPIYLSIQPFCTPLNKNVNNISCFD